MGDRFILNKKCCYCNKLNEEIYYAPTCNSLTFDCEFCKKKNFITTYFEVKKIENVTYEDIYLAINNASNMMDEKQITDYAKQLWRDWNK